MSGKGLRVADYVEHIVDAIGRIETYSRGLDEAAFLASPLVQDAVIRNLEVVGEAANNIKIADPGFLSSHPAVELDAAYRMRNALAHGYFTVNASVVWKTVQRDLPILKAQMEAIRRAI